MADTKTNFWKDLPGWAKGLIVVIILIVVIFILYKVYKMISDKQGSSDKGDVRDSQKDLNDLIKNGIKPSFQQSQYDGWANSLRLSFDGCGTDNGPWKSVFGKMNNKADVLSLIASYGIRTYDACGIGTGDTSSTLPAAITDELSSSEISELNSMLSSKGITYQF